MKFSTRVFTIMVAVIILSPIFSMINISESSLTSVFAEAIPNSVINQTTNVYSNGNDGWITVSQVGENVVVAKVGNEVELVEELYSVKMKLYVSTFKDGKVYLATTKEEFTNEHRVYTDIIRYDINSKETKSITINKTCFSYARVLFADEQGNIFLVAHSSPTKINKYNSEGELINAIDIGMSCISYAAIRPSTASIYANDETQENTMAVNLIGSNYNKIDTGRFSTHDFKFLNENLVVDNFGNVYKSESINEPFKFAYSTFSKGNAHMCCLGGKDILVSDGNKLHVIDFVTGERKGFINLSGKVLGLSNNNKGILAMVKADSQVMLEKVSLDKTQKANCELFTTRQESYDADYIAGLWDSCKPKSKDAKSVFLKKPDIKEFREIGEANQTVLDDGLAAVNFYRGLYGQSELNLNRGLSSQAQYTAILALVNDNAVKLSKPTKMSDEFFSKALSPLYTWCVYKNTKLSVSPVYEAVNHLFKTQPEFRRMLITETSGEVGFGIASDRKGNTSVFVNFGEEGTLKSENDAFIAYPQLGAVPKEIIDGSNSFTIHLNNDMIKLYDSISPSVTINDLTHHTKTVLDFSNGLLLDKNNFYLEIPKDKVRLNAGRSYNIEINKICTPDNMPAKISYNFNVFELNKHGSIWTNPEDNTNQIASGTYKIDKDAGIITGVKPYTSISEFKKQISFGDYSIKFMTADGKNKQSGNVGTGTKVLFMKQGKVKLTFNIVIYGDLTGNGTITTQDVKVLSDYLLGIGSLSKYQKIAADVNRDGKINTLDLLTIRRYVNQECDIPQS